MKKSVRSPTKPAATAGKSTEIQPPQKHKIRYSLIAQPGFGNILQFQQMQTIQNDAAEKQQERFTQEQIMAIYSVAKIVSGRIEDYKRQLFLKVLQDMRQESIRIAKLQAMLKPFIRRRVFIYWKAHCKKFIKSNLIQAYKSEIQLKNKAFQEKRLAEKIQNFMKKDDFSNFRSNQPQQSETQLQPIQIEQSYLSQQIKQPAQQIEKQKSQVISQIDQQKINHVKTSSFVYKPKATSPTLKKQNSPQRLTQQKTFKKTNSPSKNNSMIKSLSPQKNMNSERKVQASNQKVGQVKIDKKNQNQLDKGYKSQQQPQQEQMKVELKHQEQLNTMYKLQQVQKEQQRQSQLKLQKAQAMKNNQKDNYQSLQQQLAQNNYTQSQLINQNLHSDRKKRVKTDQSFDSTKAKVAPANYARLASPQYKVQSPAAIQSRKINK